MAKPAQSRVPQEEAPVTPPDLGRAKPYCNRETGPILEYFCYQFAIAIIGPAD